MNYPGPKRGVLRGSIREGRARGDGQDDIACTLYTVSDPTFVEKIGKFLDGYRSSLKPHNYFRPHKVDRRTLPIN